MAQTQQHPYFPTSLALEHFVPNEQKLGSLLTTFIGMLLTVLLPVWSFSGYISPRLGNTEKSIVLWFVLCGSLHVFFESYYVFNHDTLAGNQFLFAQLWKEYALSDSRYISTDATVLCEEAITMVLWGPMSYLTAYFILTASPYRHPFQLMVSLAHLYGDMIYILTSLVDWHIKDISYSRPEAYYFGFYFLFINSIWLFVPTALLYQSVMAITEAFRGWDDVRRIYQKRQTLEQPAHE